MSLIDKFTTDIGIDLGTSSVKIVKKYRDGHIEKLKNAYEEPLPQGWWKSILKLLQDTCRKTNTTVVVITHNKAIAPMADRVIEIKNGKVGAMSQNECPMDVAAIEW